MIKVSAKLQKTAMRQKFLMAMLNRTITDTFTSLPTTTVNGEDFCVFSKEGNEWLLVEEKNLIPRVKEAMKNQVTNFDTADMVRYLRNKFNFLDETDITTMQQVINLYLFT